jgi:signal transduction histidine kinase
LGLYYCRKTVEAHHGIIDLKSVPGVGSEFRILLPLGEDAVASDMASLVNVENNYIPDMGF